MNFDPYLIRERNEQTRREVRTLKNYYYLGKSAVLKRL